MATTQPEYCIEFLRDGVPEELLTIDRLMCEALGLPVDDTRFCMNWYNDVAYGLATGEPYTKTKASEWLLANYTYRTWVEDGPDMLN